MKTPLEPLTPEERALAQSLSRLGPHGGPSPGLNLGTASKTGKLEYSRG